MNNPKMILVAKWSLFSSTVTYGKYWHWNGHNAFRDAALGLSLGNNYTTNCLAFLFRMPCYKADVCVFYEEKAENTKCLYCDLWIILRGKTGNNASEGG